MLGDEERSEHCRRNQDDCHESLDIAPVDIPDERPHPRYPYLCADDAKDGNDDEEYTKAQHEA